MKIESINESLPANWDDCSREELLWLAEHGAYGQRMIARRYLIQWVKEHDCNTTRKQLKAIGGP